MLNKSSILVSLVIALIGVFAGLYIAQNARQQLAEYARNDEKNWLMPVDTTERTMPDDSAAHQAVSLNQDSLDWIKTLMLNTPKAYTDYLSVHPDGRYADDAIQAMELLRMQDSIKALALCDSTTAKEKTALATDSLERLEDMPETGADSLKANGSETPLQEVPDTVASEH